LLEAAAGFADFAGALTRADALADGASSLLVAVAVMRAVSLAVALAITL